MEISLRETNAFPELVVDYIEDKASLRPFYRYPPQWDSFGQAIQEQQARKYDRDTLLSLLERQYADIEKSAAVAENIRKLSSDKSFVITTAHQLNIFTGPLYIPYKILSAINLVEELEQRYPAYQFIPLFWMGSEDHDLAEINHIHLYNKKLVWETDQTGATGHMHTGGIENTIDELAAMIGHEPYGAEWISLLKKAYLPADNLSVATRRLINELFGQYGLLILDPDDASVKKMFHDVMSDDLLHHTARKEVLDTGERLSQSYHLQATPRHINLFYLRDSIRERIERDAGSGEFRILNTDIAFKDEQAIMEELRTHPERFSPNVILRPLFQQQILPSLAYIGGGGEVSYWMELLSLFRHYGIPYPLLLLRKSLQLLDPRHEQKMERLDLEANHLFKDEDALIRDYVNQQASKNLELRQESQALEDVFDQVIRKAVAIDPTLEKAVLAEKKNQLNALAKLENRIHKAEKRKHDQALQQISNLKSKLFPAGGLQERYENLGGWYARYGEAIIPFLKKRIQPLYDHLGLHSLSVLDEK